MTKKQVSAVTAAGERTSCALLSGSQTFQRIMNSNAAGKKTLGVITALEQHIPLTFQDGDYNCTIPPTKTLLVSLKQKGINTTKGNIETLLGLLKGALDYDCCGAKGKQLIAAEVKSVLGIPAKQWETIVAEVKSSIAKKEEMTMPETQPVPAADTDMPVAVELDKIAATKGIVEQLAVEERSSQQIVTQLMEQLMLATSKARELEEADERRQELLADLKDQLEGVQGEFDDALREIDRLQMQLRAAEDTIATQDGELLSLRLQASGRRRQQN